MRVLPPTCFSSKKVAPTKEIWYWEHKLPENVKAYSKTKPIQKSEIRKPEEVVAQAKKHPSRRGKSTLKYLKKMLQSRH